MKYFKTLGFELSYLALLTKENVKPLSRWENGSPLSTIKALRKLGLTTRIVERKLLNGNTKTELVFSQSSHYLDFYFNRFDNTYIKKDYETIVTEGFLFGYPGCCTMNFAKNGYTVNNFNTRDQEILFHRACPDCKITPLLLPYYERIYQECKKIFTDQQMERYGYLKKLMPAAAFSLSFLLSSTPARAADPHQLPLKTNDTDHNYLTFDEEILLGVHSNYFPVDSIPGPVKAIEFKALIDSLPIVDPNLADPPTSSCYIIEYMMRGVIECPICGALINMGYIEVFNPIRGLSTAIPYLELHFMERGSFSYGDSSNYTRTDIALLKKILAPSDTVHFPIHTSNDADNDGLRDDYEDDFDTQLNNPDSNANQLLDGAEVAEELIMAIAELPLVESPTEPPTDSTYIEVFPVWGIETCDICGISINMGQVRITNPVVQTEISFPIIGLHYLAHGRFAYSGSTNSGEIDALALAQVLGKQSTVSVLKNLPDQHKLTLTNFPNPFNPETTIRYNLPRSSHVTITIYSLLGQKIITLFDGKKAAGNYSIKWDGKNELGRVVPSGIYVYKLEDGKVTQDKRMILLR
jgi:hypothetical protein